MALRLVLSCSLLAALQLIETLPSCSEYRDSGYRETHYRGVEHRALWGCSSVASPGVGSAVRCLNLCLTTDWCRSINYDRVYAICQLNDASVEDLGVEMRQSCSVSYFGRQSAGMMYSKTRSNEVS